MKTVLVVDDNNILCETLSEHFSSTLVDYNVITAENGQRAIEVLESHDISLVITDLAMPNVDGYDFLAYVKKHHPLMPVIIMTATWSLELSALVRKLDHIQYLEKPFRLEEMDLKVAELLKTQEF